MRKAFAVESVAVMLVLILFAAAVFVVIGAGAAAFEGIIDRKTNTEAARVAYSYINMKIKQNDAASLIDVVPTDFGGALRIELPDDEYVTYIFFADDTLYECIARKDAQPRVEAANNITKLGGFGISRDGQSIRITCVCGRGGKTQTVQGVVGLRT